MCKLISYCKENRASKPHDRKIQEKGHSNILLKNKLLLFYVSVFPF